MQQRVEQSALVFLDQLSKGCSFASECFIYQLCVVIHNRSNYSDAPLSQEVPLRGRFRHFAPHLWTHHRAFCRSRQTVGEAAPRSGRLLPGQREVKGIHGRERPWALAALTRISVAAIACKAAANAPPTPLVANSTPVRQCLHPPAGNALPFGRESTYPQSPMTLISSSTLIACEMVNLKSIGSIPGSSVRIISSMIRVTG